MDENNNCTLGSQALTTGFTNAGGDVPIWLDNLNCRGSESALFACGRGTDVGTHDCDHSEDAGVCCRDGEEKGNIILMMV